MGIVSEPDNPYLCPQKINLIFAAQKLTNETNIPEYNEVVFACTVYLVHGRNHFIYSLPCGKRGYGLFIHIPLSKGGRT